MSNKLDTLGKRLASLQEPGESAAHFAKRLEESESTVGNYLRDSRVPNADFCARLRAKTGVDLNWLITGVPTPKITFGGLSERVLSRLTMVPAVVARLGHLGLDASPETAIPVLTDWLVALGLEPGECGHLTATGTGMAPAIQDGATLIVRFAKNEKMRPGDIYILAIDENILLRRYNPQPDGSIELLCDNPIFPPKILSRAQFEALGRPHRVLWAGHRL
jgi:transcriptional regulator with XRE-family HTH domain